MSKSLTCPECKSSSETGDKFRAHVRLSGPEICDVRVERNGVLMLTPVDYDLAITSDEYLIECRDCGNIWKSKRPYDYAAQQEETT